MINRFYRNKLIKQEFILITFFIKKYFKDLRTIICLIIIFVPPIYTINFINLLIESETNINQVVIDGYVYWDVFLIYSILLFRFSTIIISSDIISGDFSDRSAMILYTTPVSRNRIVISKIISMVIYLFLFQLISFIVFDITLLVMVGTFVSVNYFLFGFFLNFLNVLFCLSFSLTLSALTKHTIISILIPFFYFYIGSQLFDIFDIQQLSYTYHITIVTEGISNYIDSGVLNFGFEQFLSLILMICIPVVLIFITIVIFNRSDIRV